jgi:uncharacterized membrane protein
LILLKLEKKALLIILLLIASCALLSPAFCSEKAIDTARSLEKRGVNPLLVTGLISMLPIFELRGGIPIGIALLKQHPALVYMVSVVFNVIPIFPILLFLNPLRRLLEKLPIFYGFFRFLSRRAEKNRALVERYEEIGLMFFVAIPLPVTGAWTGSLVAVLMGLKIGKSFLFILGGVLIAGIIVTFLTLLETLGIIIAAALLSIFALVYILKLLQAKRRG